MKKVFIAALMVILLAAFGCSSQSFATKSMRTADDAPEFFTTKPGMEFSETGCRSPLMDPNDGSEIIMVESGRGIGDYRVRSGKYGMRDNELLRIDCQTGKVLGIVKK
ncbi:hypothetical protein [Gramella sp. KN1008]|uniref:hypothetical protein n=1 Tax=Gramella sp. KN1008 TaxID=2529298 RepID=UPI00103B63EF|nr:hypothetical protein [Gramella sp. KN1008]TBW29291.1 hypothetical protein EZJ28_05245 [Gramella sp. KN1008]